MKKRHRFKQTQPLEQRLAIMAQQLREEAKALPPGREREILLRRARQNEMAAEITGLLGPNGSITPA